MDKWLLIFYPVGGDLACARLATLATRRSYFETSSLGFLGLSAWLLYEEQKGLQTTVWLHSAPVCWVVPVPAAWVQHAPLSHLPSWPTCHLLRAVWGCW